jgi:Raf kinase inhibitor-like YbhB/YbcL family protein
MNYFTSIRTFLVSMTSMLTSASIAFQLSSQDFVAQGAIPTSCTCQGANKPPRLAWSNAPSTTKSFVLICDDPDAAGNQPWVHWVVYNIAPTKKDLSYITGRAQKFSDGTKQGINSFSKRGYDGPCPPVGHGVHHYHFTLYAIDTVLTLSANATKSEVLAAIKEHTITQTELIGTYERK